ncbi:hypothetical protein FNH22_27640 [Fulvivirga sp. M361]|uniref:hypothetical protein n=1 Tax=Fulvivirga sp. M361 TaxID=2594266 RepID=UPI00117A6339|nr:hypothetical protein [Fulvivirga sp. M361]TRX49219.1 hypothetical protein FNH22_27640 [Fulvivirga sp. M361]
MSQDLLKSHLSTLERKLNLLLKEHRSSKDHIASLQQENDELRSFLKAKDEQIASFQNKIKISKIVREIDSDEDTSELKRKIDEYIKEIDKCITHLS